MFDTDLCLGRVESGRTGSALGRETQPNVENRPSKSSHTGAVTRLLPCRRSCIELRESFYFFIGVLVVRLLFISALLVPSIGLATKPAEHERASWPTEFSRAKCQNSVEKTLQAHLWRKDETWVRRVDTDSMTKAYRRARAELGAWVDLEISEGGDVTVTESSAKARVVSHWDADCRLKTLSLSPLELASSRTKGFRDRDLAKLLQSKKKAMIYLWSPRFVYSAGALPYFALAAKRQGYEFIPLLDPRESVQFAEQRVNLAKRELEQTLKDRSMASVRSEAVFPKMDLTRKLLSLEVFRANGFNHFPVAYLVENGQFNPRPMIGVLTTADIERAMKEWPFGFGPPVASAQASVPSPQARDIASLPAGGACTAAFTYLPFKGSWVQPDEGGRISLGIYTRVSPDGRYLLRSHSGSGLTDVTVMELDRQKKTVRPYLTSLSGEAFAVQGTWRYVVDVDGSHYHLRDILRDQKRAKAQFRAGVRGFYATAAELPGGTKSAHRIRSLSWPSPSETGLMGTQEAGALFNEVVDVAVDSAGNADDKDSTGNRYLCRNLKSSDGWMFSLPMVSADGMEFAARPQNPKDRLGGIRIYEFGANHEDCRLVDRVDFMSSKVVFGYPKKGQKPPVVFYEGSSGIVGLHYYDRVLKRVFAVRDTSRRSVVDGYPGFTRDGRLVYGARWDSCDAGGRCVEETGYVIADPYQSEDVRSFRRAHPEANLPECIAESEVLKVEAEQREIYGL